MSSAKKGSENEKLEKFKLIFQASTVPNVVLMNGKDMRSMNISSCGAILVSQETQLILTAMSSKLVQSGSIVISQLHSPNFESNSFVNCAKVSPRYFLSSYYCWLD